MWPSFLTGNFDEVHDYGRGGAGNEYIFHSVLDALANKNITKGDTVVVVWSTYGRNDVYLQHGWVTRGNVYNYQTPEEVDKIWSIEGAIHKTWSYIYALREILKSKDITFCFSSMDSIFKVEDVKTITPAMMDFVKDYKKLTSDIFCTDDLSSFTRKQFAKRHRYLLETPGKEPLYDGHPNVLVSNSFVKLVICPKLKITQDPEMDNLAEEIDTMLRSGVISSALNTMTNEVTDFRKLPLTKDLMFKYRDRLKELYA